MATRRQVLGSGALLSATLPLAGIVSAANDRAKSSLRATSFVFDSRYLSATELSKRVAAAGVPVAAVSGDLWRLWYDKLDKRWRKAPDVISGYTGAEDLFVLQTLAADRGMRLYFKGQHAMIADHRMSNRFTASGAATTVLLGKPETLWTLALPGILTNCAVAPGPVQASQIVTPTKAFKSQPTLYSWLMGPSGALKQALIA